MEEYQTGGLGESQLSVQMRFICALGAAALRPWGGAQGWRRSFPNYRLN